MKLSSISLIVIVLIAAFSMTSCVKSYTCHCNIYYSGAPGLPDSTTSEYSITDTKSGAQSKCKSNTTTYSGTYSNNYITTTESCYLY